MKIAASTAAESRIEAYKWYRLAAAQGYGTSQNSCDVVTMSMSREEVTQGNQRASAFVAKHCL
jgi:TPR repeat protein